MFEHARQTDIYIALILLCIVDIQRYARTYDVPHFQVSPVVKEAIGMSRLLLKSMQIQWRQHLQSSPSGSWGDWDSNIFTIVSNKNFDLEEIFQDNR